MKIKDNKDHENDLETIARLEDAGLDRDPLIKNAIILGKKYAYFSDLEKILND